MSSRDIGTMDIETVTERIFDLSTLLAELECEEKIPDMIDEVLKLFKGDKRSARIICRNGAEIYIEKRRFDLYVETR